MKTKIVVFFSLFFIFINLLSINAQPPFQDLSVTLKIESNYNDYHKVNEPLLIHVHVYDSVTGIAYPAGDVNMTIHLYSHDLGGELIYETQAINNTYWTTETIIDGSYFNETGQYSISINADSLTEVKGGYSLYHFIVTTYGEETNNPTLILQLAIILSFFLFMIILHFTTKDINFESWNNKIIKKYQNKNYIKLVFSSITYNILKSKYVFYYLFGLPIFVSLISLSNSYNLVGMVELFRSIFIVYSVGSILVAIYFFSHVQEWLVDLFDNIKNLDWGIEK